jgi:inorganic triphosphatase YgiF
LARALEARAGGAAARTRLVSTYYDTRDHALARRGLALRVREHNGRFVQTVKSGDPNGAPLLVRGEWEDAIAGPRPDLDAAASGPLLPRDIAGRLIPLFRTEVSRQIIDLSPAPGTRIEAAIDRGRIVAPDCAGSEPISEVELELKSGELAALYDVALDLLAVAPLRAWGPSKAERGYRLTAGDAPPPSAVHAAAVELDSTMSGDEALRRIGIACLDQLVRNEPAVRAGDAEGIHQMRVAVRRLRAILSAFSRLLPAAQRRRASDELHWLAGALSAARNLDVFAQALLAPAQQALPDNIGIAALATAAEQRRRAAYADAKRAIASTRYTTLVLRLLRWFESCGWQEGAASTDLRQPMAILAAQVLNRRRRAAQRCSKGFDKQSARRRHRLRIALKKLRYATELLAALYDQGEIERFTRRLKRLQDDLGDANDLRVGYDIVAELARPRRRAGMLEAAGQTVLDWHERRLADREPLLRRHLDRLLAAEPFWSR